MRLTIYSLLAACMCVAMTTAAEAQSRWSSSGGNWAQSAPPSTVQSQRVPQQRLPARTTRGRSPSGESWARQAQSPSARQPRMQQRRPQSAPAAQQQMAPQQPRAQVPPRRGRARQVQPRTQYRTPMQQQRRPQQRMVPQQQAPVGATGNRGYSGGGRYQYYGPPMPTQFNLRKAWNVGSGATQLGITPTRGAAQGYCAAIHSNPIRGGECVSGFEFQNSRRRIDAHNSILWRRHLQRELRR